MGEVQGRPTFVWEGRRVGRSAVHCILAAAGGRIGGAGWRGALRRAVRVWAARGVGKISELAKDFSVHIGFSFVWQ
jgi:hypothetical protein